MNGLMYAQQFNDDAKCVHVANGNSRELSIIFNEGTCGLAKTPTPVCCFYEKKIFCSIIILLGPYWF